MTNLPEPTRTHAVKPNDVDPPMPEPDPRDPLLADCGCWRFPLMMTGRHWPTCHRTTDEFAAMWVGGEKLIQLPARQGEPIESVYAVAHSGSYPETKIRRSDGRTRWIPDCYLMQPPNVIL